MKFAFSARSEVTDPAFVKDADRLDRFWKTDWPDKARKKITDVSFSGPLIVERKLMPKNSTHKIDYYGMEHESIEDHGTTHLSVVDQWGGVAAVTSTVSSGSSYVGLLMLIMQVNLIWGSHVMCPETGVIFNDEQGAYTKHVTRKGLYGRR